MYSLTLQQLFGVNCYQDGQVLVINKSDLPLLTPSDNNSAESLLVAIILKALDNFQGNITDDNNQPITDEYNNPITYDNQNLYELLNCFKWDDKFIKRNGLTVRNTIVVENFEYVEY